MNILKIHNMDQMEFEDLRGKNELLNNEFYKHQIKQELVQNENGKNENNNMQDSEKHILGILNS